MSIQNYNYLFKYIIIGDSAVGKSNILLRYVQDKFNEEFQSTIGVEFGTKNIEINNKICRVQIWDTAGQDRFRSITRNYYKGAHGIIVIYDVTNRKTFENVKNWIKQIKEEVSTKVSINLVGNKIDDTENRKVTEEEGKNLAESFGVSFFEASAKDGLGVNECFLDLVKKTVNVYGNNANNNAGGRLNDAKNSGKKKGCC